MIRKILKKFIPKKIFDLYKNRRKNKTIIEINRIVFEYTLRVRILYYKFVSSTKLTSSLHYLFFGKFWREQQKVLKGKLNYLKSIKNPEGNQSLLRRNIHRIEKGLLMMPRRPTFALDYIEETVTTFGLRVQSSLMNNGNVDNDELLWANDVLHEYFKTVASDPIIDKSKRLYLETKKKFNYGNSKKSEYRPYLRNRSDQINISYDELSKLALHRRSVRWFKQIKVERDKIDKAIEIASLSPTACNRQPYEFRIIDDPVLLNKVATLPQGTTGYVDNIPVLVVAIGKLDAYFSERDRHLIYIDTSLAIMSLIFALETLGLSSCCINWPDIEKLEKKMEERLNLKSFERPIMCLAIGYPLEEGKVAYSKKKSIDTIRKYNQGIT